MPLGWSSSPFHFCKIVRGFVGFPRYKNIRIVSYVEDFILTANAAGIECQKIWVLKLGKFGFKLNEKNSQVIPSTQTKFIGFVVETGNTAGQVEITIPKQRI